MSKVATVSKPDMHAITPLPQRGPGVYEVVNNRTGERVEVCGSFGDALAAQAKWNAAAVGKASV